MVQPVFFLLFTLLSLQIANANQISDADLHPSANWYTAGRGISEILDYVKHAIESAQQTIKNITDSLSTLVKDLQDKINNTVSSFPITVIINQLKDEIARVVAKGGALSEACGKEADVQVNDLLGKSSKASQECINETQNVITQVKTNIKNLANKARDMLDDFVVQVVSCVQDNKLNPINLVKCLQSQIEPFKAKMDQIQQEVESSVTAAKDNAKESVYKLAECINELQISTVKTSQVILSDVENCIAGK